MALLGIGLAALIFIWAPYIQYDPKLDPVWEDFIFVYPFVVTSAACAWSLWKAALLLRAHRPSAKPRGKFLPRWAKTVIITLIACTMVPYLFPILYFLMFILTLKTGAGPFDRPRMEHIVQQVRAQPFHDSQDFVADSTGNIHIRASNNEPINVIADRGEDGSLVVQIVTNPEGHAGSWGFIYMDPPVPMEKEDGADDGRLTTPGTGWLHATYPKDRIDNHWMRAWDDED
jgi:hypothetical protein